MEKKYYHAYDDRYRQVHSLGLQWSSYEPSKIVSQTMARYAITKDHRILELGCGEGRDAFNLLDRGFSLLATDISPEAIAYCRRKMPEKASSFRVLNCIGGELEEQFDFIYAVAVIHMLVEQEDRDGFYHFIRNHLNSGGVALIGTMGDGIVERQSDVRTAFDLQKRTHEATGKELQLAGTSCRMVSFPAFLQEISQNGLETIEHGLTAVEPDFPVMMYAVVKKS